jgi:hypothetical protein
VAAKRTRSTPASSAAHIWWGPVASEPQAREIIAWTAWSLIIIGLAPAAALMVSAALGEVAVAAPYYANLGDNWFVLGQSAFLCVELTAAWVLLRKHFWTAALVLFFCCVFVIAVVLATLVRLTREGATLAIQLEDLLLIACLLFFTRLVWRALEATAALRKLRTVEAFT